jgi:hypothetical protein
VEVASWSFDGKRLTTCIGSVGGQRVSLTAET